MPPIIVRPIDRRPYESCREEMQRFTESRTDTTRDEIWLIEHPPVYTLGLAGKTEHLLATAADTHSAIPVIRTERGGQVTYHGPGQLVAYTLVDLRRAGLTVKTMVCRLEQAVIDTLAGLGIAAERKDGAPGVYVAGPELHSGSKIGALGLKVRRGCTYHGLALNVAMDLTPFLSINPCGYPDLTVTDVRTLLLARSPAPPASQIPGIDSLAPSLAANLTANLTTQPV